MGLAARLAPLRPRSVFTSVLLCRNLSDPLPAAAPPDDVRFEWADASGIARLVAEPLTRSGEAVRRSQAAGHRCMCAVRGQEVLGYSWVCSGMAHSSFGERTEMEMMRLPKGDAFGFDLFISPRSRRAGIGLTLVAAQFHCLRDEGFSRRWAAVDVANRPSLRLCRKLGSRPRCLAYSFVVGPWRRTFVRPPREPRRLEAWFDAL